MGFPPFTTENGKELYIMSEKRRDSKGRILRTGESQRKDGRYAYKYMDAYGKPQFVYAWKLVSTDKTPAGKRDGLSLREKIDTIGKRMTVCQLYAKQNSQRKNVKRSTEKGREYLMSILKSDPLGARSIDTVKPSDAKEWAIRMSEKGYAYKTINNWKRSLKASFYTAIEDDCIRKNAFNFALDTVLEDDTEPKIALTQEQEDSLLAFAAGDPVYKNFLFLNQSGYPKVSSSYESMFQGLVRKYNKQHKPEEALPNITPHTLRHTFCTRLANAGMNPKALQYIMGHSNITMTPNYYAHADYTSAKAEMDRLAA